ncbi:MAG: PRC-barrel domain-containing protein [Candidatus Saccharibacteria bacterium]|nr:PRC-barrel domain-containing protein [Candidatus Saccharibacteria bacterium]
MLMLASKLKDASVMSLQTGAKVAQVTEPVISPATLDIIAYHLTGKTLDSKDSLLLTRDVREVGNLGLIIDSVDELVLAEDMVKIKEILDINFHIIDMTVIDDKSTKLGRVYDFSIDPMDFKIHQIYVKRPLMKSLQTSDLIINRTQITEINNKYIVVNSASLDEKASPVNVTENFVNPFRKPSAPPASTASTKTT